MVSIPQRMRKLQTKLLAMRLGSGALILPKDVKRLHMRFAKKIDGGHMGPRKFWHHELVRLQYHNPSVSMTTDRTAASEDQPTLSIHYATANSNTQSSTEATSTERVETIDMRLRTNSEILTELVRITRATPVEPTAEDREQLSLLEEQRARSQRDSKLSAEVRARKARELQLLEQAKGEVAGLAA